MAGCRIGVPAGNTQCLFSSDADLRPPRPVGVVLFGRPTPDVIWISHLAVDPAYISSPQNQWNGLGGILVERVREIACHIKGVDRIQLPYQRDCFLRVRPPRNRISPA